MNPDAVIDGAPMRLDEIQDLRRLYQARVTLLQLRGHCVPFSDSQILRLLDEIDSRIGIEETRILRDDKPASEGRLFMSHANGVRVFRHYRPPQGGKTTLALSMAECWKAAGVASCYMLPYPLGPSDKKRISAEVEVSQFRPLPFSVHPDKPRFVVLDDCDRMDITEGAPDLVAAKAMGSWGGLEVHSFHTIVSGDGVLADLDEDWEALA